MPGKSDALGRAVRRKRKVNEQFAMPDLTKDRERTQRTAAGASRGVAAASVGGMAAGVDFFTGTRQRRKKKKKK